MNAQVNSVAAGTPVAGFYRMKLRRDGVYAAIRVWYGPPLDPFTREEMDRSWRWQAEAGGRPIDLERVWPQCAKEPIDQKQFTRLLMQSAWSRENAPDSGHADPTRKLDLLSPDTPLPF
jgi:hypothetical protein